MSKPLRLFSLFVLLSVSVTVVAGQDIEVTIELALKVPSSRLKAVIRLVPIKRTVEIWHFYELSPA
jgi:hypothetical protein